MLTGLQAAAEAESVTVEVVAAKVGGATASDGSLVSADQKLDGAPSVLYDAVVIAASEQGAADLTGSPAARDFVSDAYAHGKFIGYTAPTMALFSACGLDHRIDDGFVEIRDERVRGQGFPGPLPPGPLLGPPAGLSTHARELGSTHRRVATRKAAAGRRRRYWPGSSGASRPRPAWIGWASPLGAGLHRLLRPGPVVDALSGKALGHPAHPALVSAPIGCWTGALVADLAGEPRAGRILTGLGVLSALPVAATGASDWADTTGAEQRVGVVHLGLNLAATVLLRRRRGGPAAATATASEWG